VTAANEHTAPIAIVRVLAFGGAGIRDTRRSSRVFAAGVPGRRLGRDTPWARIAAFDARGRDRSTTALDAGARLYPITPPAVQAPRSSRMPQYPR
jgi:hypothetical protein